MINMIKNLALVLVFLSISNCGFKISDQSQNNNFKIREIQTTGNKRINFKIKNNLLINSSNTSDNFITIKIDTKKIKRIKEKNIKNEITKYQITIATKVELLELKNYENFIFNVSVTNEYLVGQNYSMTLTNEKKITDYIVDDLSEKILNKINLKINDS